MSCCSSSTSRDSDVSSGFASRLRAVSSLRRTTGGTDATVSHSAGDEWCSHRCTSRCSASAASTCSRAGESRLAPNTDSRAGRSLSDGSSRSRVQASSSSSAGLGVPRRVAQPAPQLGLPGEVRVERAAVTSLVPAGGPGAQHLRPGLPVLVVHRRQPAGDREPSSLVLGVGAEVLRERPGPRLGRDRRVDDVEQRPHRPRRRPQRDSSRRARPTTTPAPRRPACSATGTRRSRRRRRPPTYRARATAAGRSSARPPSPAPRRPRPRTGRPAGRRARRPARGPAQPRAAPGG